MATARRRAIAQADQRWNIPLGGVKDGVNTTFDTPEKYRQVGNLVIRVYLNGQRLVLGGGADYTVAESGGMGSGFDTVILSFALIPTDVLTADYVFAP